MWLWVLFFLICVLLIMCLWSLCKVSSNADARLKRLIKKTPTYLATTQTEYIYKRYLKIYTPEEVFGQATEELAELIQALNKVLRSVNKTTPTTYAEAYENLVEEVADATIMLEVISQALELDKDQLATVKAAKLNRLQDRTIEQAERRGREYGKKAEVLLTTKTGR